MLNGAGVLRGTREIIEWPDTTGEPGSGPWRVCGTGFSGKSHMVERASRVNRGRCQAFTGALTICLDRGRSGFTPSAVGRAETRGQIVPRKNPPADTRFRGQGWTVQERRDHRSRWTISPQTSFVSGLFFFIRLLRLPPALAGGGSVGGRHVGNLGIRSRSRLYWWLFCLAFTLIVEGQLVPQADILARSRVIGEIYGNASQSPQIDNDVA